MRFAAEIGCISARNSGDWDDCCAADHVLRCGDSFTTGSTGVHRDAQGKSICDGVESENHPVVMVLGFAARIVTAVLEPARAMNETKHDAIRAYYHALFSAWGHQHWWPAQSRLEMIVGAYLTQNTAWTNVEKALANLRRARLLTISGIRRTPRTRLEQLIRPAGYFRQKAQRLKTFVHFLDERYSGSFERMFARPTGELRDELLALNGVGPETADSILLYAGNHPVFVVDAYTRRILERHGIVSSATDYNEIRLLFEQALVSTRPPKRGLDGAPSEGNRGNETASGSAESGPAMTAAGRQGSGHRPSRLSTAERTVLVQVFNEMHGLIVGVGKNHCLKSQPLCEQCPLQKFLPKAK